MPRRLITSCLAALFGAAPAGSQPTATVGIDLLIESGNPASLTLVSGLRYRVDQLDVTAHDSRTEDDELAGLRTAPPFDRLSWTGLEATWVDSVSGLDGQPFLREIYRHARWMVRDHTFVLTPVDRHGAALGRPMTLLSARDAPALPDDDFPIRRNVVVRDVRDGTYEAEAWLQLRNAMAVDRPDIAFDADPRLAALRLEWPAAGASFDVPVRLVSDPTFAYGFDIVADRVDAGWSQPVEPGGALSVRLTFTDGAGTPLHPRGSLPTYNEFLAGLESGLRYFDFYPSVLFFKDKNKEGVLLAAIAGPVERIRQSYTEVSLEQFALEQQAVALPERDGYLATWELVPSADILFGGLADPDLWDTPVPDRLDFVLPETALSGEYLFVVKARRVYLGESSLVTTVERFRVDGNTLAAVPESGEPAPVETAIATFLRDGPAAARALDRSRQPAGWVGRCSECHRHEFHFDLADLLHGNDEQASCAVCHAPLAFEPDNMLAYRMHYVHFFSERNPMDPLDCQSCHISKYSVERASLLVCLSCHIDYHGGAEHFGPYNRCDEPICHDAHDF